MDIYRLAVDTPAISVNTPGISVDTPSVSVDTPNSINPIYPATQRPEFSGSAVVSPHPRHLRSRPTPYTPTLHIYLTHLPYTLTRPCLTHLEALHTPQGPALHTYEALEGLLTELLGGLLEGLLVGLLGGLLEGLCQVLRPSAYCARLVSMRKHVESE